jgi:galactokinase
MTGKELLALFEGQEGKALWTMLYGEDQIETARRRYSGLVEELLDEQAFPREEFPETRGELRVFSAPGRTELGGNHTDHNRGKVLAGSIQLDEAAVGAARKDKRVFFRSVGHPDVEVDLGDLSPRQEEIGTTEALVRGIAGEFAARGLPVGGFTVNAASTVLTGSGLSSSAAVEMLLARIFDTLWGKGELGPLEIARIGQRAENVYFGKPCGLMDQAACAGGGASLIDFEDPALPRVKKIDFNPLEAGYGLCVVNTRGSHADLTPHYAAIPEEMRAVAAFFGGKELRDLNLETVLAGAGDLRKKTGDRAVLRAIHFFRENERVDAMEQCLGELHAAQGREAKQAPMARFLALVNESGDSSWELLQNIYAPSDPAWQGLSLALALTREFLRSLGGESRGACRVHGGGFAGTIQAYIPVEALRGYQARMEGVFGEGAVTELRIRPRGAVEIFT